MIKSAVCSISSFHFNGFLGAFLEADLATYALVLVHHVFFLELSGNGIDRAILGTDVAAHAFIGIDLGFPAFSCQEILNGMSGTFGGTDAAIDADIVVYACQIVRDGDGIDGAVPAADSTADTRLVIAADTLGDIAFVF